MNEVLFTKLVNGGRAYLKAVYSEEAGETYWSIFPIVDYIDNDGSKCSVVLKYPVYHDWFYAESKDSAIANILEIDSKIKTVVGVDDIQILRIGQSEAWTDKLFWAAAEDCPRCVYFYNDFDDCQYIVSIVDDNMAEVADQHSMISFCVQTTRFKDTLL